MAAKLKNLEQEVDLLISEDESDAVSKKSPATRRSSRTAATAAPEKTPSRAHPQKKPDLGDKTPQQAAGLQTPRRSTRKSIRPAQDYDDIVTKSAGKSANGQRDDHTDDEHGEAPAAVRWTPAKVGRVSEKRRGRSRRLAKKEKQQAAANDSDAENASSAGNNRQTESVPPATTEDKSEVGAAKKAGKRAKRARGKKGEKVVETKGAEPVGMDASQTKEDLIQQEKETPLVALEEKKDSPIAKDNEENVDEHEKKPASATTGGEIEVVAVEGEQAVGEQVAEPLQIGKGAPDDADAATGEGANTIKEGSDLSYSDPKEGPDVGDVYTKEKPDAGDVDTKEGPNAGDVDTEEGSDVGDVDTEEGPGDDVGDVDTMEKPDVDDVDPEEGSDAAGLTTKDQKVDTNACEPAKPPAASSPGAGKGCAASKALFDGNSPGSGHFGTYLQTHQEDLEDLGLNPLAGGGDANEEKPPTAAGETYEDMPTLRIDDVAEAPPSPNGSGDTFNVSDCIVVGDETPPAEGRATPLSDVEMQPLQISDDEADDEQPAQPPALPPIPRIVIEDVDVAAKPEVAAAPVAALRASLRRQPTPHKKRDTVSSELKALAREEANAPAAVTIELPVTTLPAKQIVLQGIRKRSLSMSVGEGAKSSKGVRFHSPANQTMMCDEIDLKLARSAKKLKTAADEFVTQRRRRSKSADEGLTMRLKRLATPTKNKGVPPAEGVPANDKKIPRCKIPNFRAIHEKHFEQMENLLEHMRRKTERAQLLTNSATKQKPPREPAEDGPPSSQSKARLAIIPAGTGAVGTEKPKAPAAAGRKALREPNVAAAASAKGQKAPAGGKKPPFNLSTQLEANKSRIPLSVTICGATTTSTSGVEASKQLNTTSSLATGSRITRIPVATAATDGGRHNANVTLAYDDLVAARRKRHMDLFKGRSANARVGLGTTQRPAAIIRGVRSNRRFELQMQHRHNKMDPN